MQEHLTKLYRSLGERWRPEDVAQAILELLRGRLDRKQEALLDQAARGSLKRQVFGYTSMLQEFARPVGMQHQVAKAAELFATAPALRPDECDDPDRVEEFLCRISPEIRKALGSNDFRQDRLNHQARLEAGLDLSRRRYNKLFRLLVRMEAKLQRLVREIRKHRLTKISKSGLASFLSWEEFSADVDTACFLAYLTARANLRSEFTIAGQQRAFDEIAEMLLSRCRDNGETHWWAVAHAHPSAEVLGHLTGEQKGTLLGRWFGILQDVGGLLKETYDRSDINRVTMIVRRGNDSTTWNVTAGAWNKARDHWIALVYALGMDDLLDSLCFGKVLRLMAGDVAAWHRRAGGGLDPNTDVWNDLPLPWEVLSGEQSCTRRQIEETCRRHDVDPVKSGWTAPRPRTAVAAFRPTPELVHGVTVASPFLATLLKRAGYFSGKHPAAPQTADVHNN